MSIKNQHRLPLFALMIIGTTVLSLVGLNYLVEGISKKKPQMAEAKAPAPANPMGAKDDALDAPIARPKAGPQPGMIPPPGMKGMPNPFDKNNKMMPPMPYPGPENGQGVMRRMHGNGNGRGPMDPRIERTQPPSPQERNDKNGAAARDPRDRMQQPPSPPPQGGNQYQPSQEEMMRMEMERRRMMDDYPPPPPPGYFDRDGGYDDRYEGPPEDYYDYYDQGYEGKLDSKEKEDTRTSQTFDHHDVHAGTEEDPDSFMEDEYLYDLLDDDDVDIDED